MNRLQCDVWLRTVFRRAAIEYANAIRKREMLHALPWYMRSKCAAINAKAFDALDPIYISLAAISRAIVVGHPNKREARVSHMMMNFAMALTLINHAEDELISDELLVDLELLDYDP